MATPAFSVEMAKHEDVAVVSVGGEIDIATGPQLWAALEAAMTEADRLVLDLSGTSFMDSTGLGLIIRATTAFGADRIVVRSPQPRVLALFDLTGMRRHITIDGVDGED
jgi:anti-sigma B factor antagonist